MQIAIDLPGDFIAFQGEQTGSNFKIVKYVMLEYLSCLLNTCVHTVAPGYPVP